MEVIETGLEGCLMMQPRLFEDNRGYFYESFNQKTFAEVTGVDRPFIQDNQSYSHYGVIRALHAQEGEYAQAKLVRVVKGKVLDVAVDARRESATFGKHVAVELSAENRRQLYIPRGFLHGFSVLSEDAIFLYKVDNVYSAQSEIGVSYKCSFLGIDWKVPEDSRIISEKDKVLPGFRTRFGLK